VEGNRDEAADLRGCGSRTRLGSDAAEMGRGSETRKNFVAGN
jgi:hypothetical protein